MFQYDFGPPKHVLHLVWSVLGISTAIKTALKVALYDFFDGPLAPLNGQFMEKVNHYNRTKHKDFLMGPSEEKKDIFVERHFSITLHGLEFSWSLHTRRYRHPSAGYIYRYHAFIFAVYDLIIIRTITYILQAILWKNRI